MTITVTATSTTDTSLTASETITVYPETVSISGPAAGSTLIPLTTANFSATVINDPTPQDGVTWSVSGPLCSGQTSTAAGCGVFPNTSPVQATFSAPPAPQLEMITVTATAVDAPRETASITFIVPKLAIYIFTPTLLPAAISGTPYSATTSIIGNTPPYTIQISSPLPSWLTATVSGYGTTCNPAGTAPCAGNTVSFSGTPPAGTQQILYPSVQVTDSAAQPDTGGQSLAIAVYPQAGTGNSLLTGSYAFYGIGFHDGSLAGTYGNSQNPIYYIGSFTADGSGHITGGELDVNDSLSTKGITSYSSLGGTYEIQAVSVNGTQLPNGQTGYMTLVPPGNPQSPITMAVSLSSLLATTTTPSFTLAHAGHFVEFDDLTGIGGNLTGYSTGIRVSGSIAYQSASVLNTTAAPLTASPFTNGSAYAYGMNGFSAVKDFPISLFATKALVCLSGGSSPALYPNPYCGPISVAGSMAFGASGAITSGIEDVLVGEQHSTPTLSGSTANSGVPDANGRVVTTVNTATTAMMADWPSHYAIYAINPSGTASGGEFYMMSIDSNLTNSTIVGEFDQQNLADIASAPFSSNPFALYVNENGAGNYNDQGTNGQDRVIMQFLTPTISSATSGSFAGYQFTNLSGTYSTGPGPGTVSSFAYSVTPSTGRVVPNNGVTITEPCMYLIDTSQGWGIQCQTAQQSGLWQFMPQTATTLNAGTYSYYVFSQIEPTAPLETGTIWLPTGGVPANATTIPVAGGYDYTQFYSPATAYVQPSGVYTYAEPIEYAGAIITPSSIQVQAGGEIYRSTATAGSGIQLYGTGSEPSLSTFQGCGQNTLAGGGGFILTPTSFVCVPSGGSFGGVHVFTQ